MLFCQDGVDVGVDFSKLSNKTFCGRSYAYSTNDSQKLVRFLKLMPVSASLFSPADGHLTVTSLTSMKYSTDVDVIVLSNLIIFCAALLSLLELTFCSWEISSSKRKSCIIAIITITIITITTIILVYA